MLIKARSSTPNSPQTDREPAGQYFADRVADFKHARHSKLCQGGGQHAQVLKARGHLDSHQPVLRRR